MEISKKKYLFYLLFPIIFIAIFFIVGILSPTSDAATVSETFTPGFPFNNLPVIVFYALCFVFWFVGAIIGAVIFGYGLGPLYLFIHKNIMGRKLDYGIIEVSNPNPDKFNGAFKNFFPALLTLNLAILISTEESIMISLLNDGIDALPGTYMRLILFLISFTTIFGMGLFSPAWMLEESGLVCSNNEKLKKKRGLIEVKSVGGWFNYFLKGYAGISVMISFYKILGDYIIEGIQLTGFVLIGILPIIIMMVMWPAAVVLDITSDHRRKYLLKYATKFGIVDQLTVSIEKK